MKNRILEFNRFLNEADFKENPAVTKEYLNSLNDRARRNIAELEHKYGADIPRFMSFVSRAQRIQSGREKELEALAYKAIMSEFEDILGDTTITFEIPTSRIKMPKHEECKDCKLPGKKEIEDSKIIDAIHKRKLLNMVAQGEALNAKKIFLNPVSRNGIISIFGRSEGEEYLDLLKKITDIAMVYDWNIPAEVQKEMWENNDAFAGISKIEWKHKEKKKEEEEEDEDNSNNGDTEDYTAEIMVKGMDYAMLIHEAIKGIWGLINQTGMAHLSDPEIEKVFPNTDTIGDEIQDIKLARITTEDLRDFLNTFPELSSLKNGRAYVWGKMIDANVFTDKEFIELMKFIWSAAPLYKKGETYSKEETEEAELAMNKIKPVISNLIKDIIKEVREWDSNNALGIYSDSPEEYDDSDEEIELSVDSILDKINKSGISSLTPEERDFLDSQNR